MIVKKIGNTITINLDTESEQKTAEWLWEQYQEHYLKDILVRLLANQQRARIAMRIRKEVEEEINGNQH